MNRVDPSGRCIGPLIFLAPACVGAAVGLVSYVGGTVATNILQGNEPPQGLNAADAVISTVAGGLSGGVGAQPISLVSKIAINAIIGFDATVSSMVTGGRRDVAELVMGTAFGGFGGAIDIDLGGSGFNGVARAIAGNGTLSNLLTLLQNLATGMAESLGVGSVGK